jgi:hypothetical protein
LARSISRVAYGGLDVPEDVAAAGEAIELEWARPLGGVHVAQALWEALGIGEVLRSHQRPRGRRAPHELALFTMVANCLLEPVSKLACHEHWGPERVSLPEADALTLDQLTSRSTSWTPTSPRSSGRSSSARRTSSAPTST